jgi:prepilin-type N-terminal cleavage/methylation domain-containing protein
MLHLRFKVKSRIAAGFTLMELLIVLAIISIVGVIGSYNWNHYVRNTELRTFARELTGDIAELKMKAKKDGLCYRITIYTAANGNKYTLEKANQPGGCDGATFTLQKTKSPASLGLRDGLNISSTSYSGSHINFQTRGTINMGKVIMTNQKGSEATITSNITGKTYVEYSMR